MRPTLAVAAALLLVVVPPGAAAAAAPSTGGPSPADGGTGPYTGGLAAPPGASAAGDEHDACEPVAAGPQREHPENDTLGWEGGCWFDDPIDVTVEDGLDGTELVALVARTMARIEHVRGLEFQESVPVEVVSRGTYVERTRAAFANASDEARLHRNVEYEALFFVGEGADALRAEASNRGESVLGYYAPTRDRIVVVADDGGDEQLPLDERTLAHELTHALQDQHFDIGRYDRSTTERRNAVNGLVEGDAHHVEQRYMERCDGGWNCSNVDDGSEVPDGFHWGIYFLNYQPYSDGPAFVADLRERGGWEAVDEAYGDPPASSEQVIHPAKYPDERPANVTVEDRSDHRWRPLAVEPGPVHSGADQVEVGEAGLATMFVYPAFEDSPEFVTQRAFYNPPSERSPLDYGVRYSDGWAGDELRPYVTDDSAVTNETGYVWKTAWDSGAEAEEFASAYVRLLALHGAEPVDGRVATYRIPDDGRFGDAFYVNRSGDAVVIVNAPTVDALPAVRAGAAPEPPATTPALPTVDDDGVVPPVGTVTTPAEPFSTTSPGAGVAVALVALTLLALGFRLR